jgi:hypothetical protein
MILERDCRRGPSSLLFAVLAACSGGGEEQTSEAPLTQQADAITTGCVPSPTVHCGDVQISGQAQADLYAGVTTFVGNVTIKAGQVLYMTDNLGNKFWVPNLVFSMPSLAIVKGNLIVHGGRMATVDLPLLKRVGGDLTINITHFMTAPPIDLHAVTALNTPNFTQVSGNIELNATRDPDIPGQTTAHVYDFGLDAMNSVGGDITVNNDSLPAHASALGGLKKVVGDLTINWRNSDMSSSSLLEKVTEVGGDVLLIAPINSRQLMPELQAIAGGLEIRPDPASVTLQNAKVFPKLASIGGDLRLVSTAPSDCHTELGALKQVGGTILLENTKMKGHLGSTGAEPLVAGGIEIRSGSQGAIPFFSDLELTPGAAVSIHHNPLLCPCTIQPFVSQLVANGWTGPLNTSNNGMPILCIFCPTSTCSP